MCVRAHVRIHTSGGRVSDPWGAGVIGVRELPDLGVRIQTPVLVIGQ